LTAGPRGWDHLTSLGRPDKEGIMRPGPRPRPTYANVTATLALFVALGGGAYAATALPANSVGSKQLKKNAVAAAKIKSNAVTRSKVRDNSLTGADINEASVAKVPAAALADAATHATAAAAIDKVTYKTAAGTAPPSSAATAATATCDSGQHVVGGGVKLDPPGIGVVNDSYPDTSNTAWTAHVGNGTSGNTATSLSFTVYAICTSVTGVG
jgi:uncharacterized iron-regulated membrane protein